jgi:sRNA-binding carbon storage regulator CsrA
MLCLKLNERLIVTASNGERIEFVNRESKPVKVGVKAPLKVKVVRGEVEDKERAE